MASFSVLGTRNSVQSERKFSKCSQSIQPNVYKAMEAMSIRGLSSCSEEEIRPVLPALVRMALYPPLDSSAEGIKERKSILAILSNMEAVNGIVDMLSIDFHSLEQDVKKEQQLRSKVGSSATESVLISQLTKGIALEFERSQGNSAQRIRLLLSDLLFIISELKDEKAGSFLKQSDLFESHVYRNEIMDALCISIAELPQLLNINDIAEALLSVSNGPDLVCQLVANAPESFLPVCQHIIARSEKYEEDSVAGRCRFTLLHKLCVMNPMAALTVRNLCVEYASMPGFVVTISLQQPTTSRANPIRPQQEFTSSMEVDDDSQTDDDATNRDEAKGSDIVPFLSGILLGPDMVARNWIASYIKMAQKHKPEWSSLVQLRQHLLHQVRRLTPVSGQSLPQGHLVQASALLRLYSALKAIANMKLTEEEMSSLLQLVVSRPHLSPSGAHFLSLVICFVIATPGIVRSMEEEQQLIGWLKMMMASDERFHNYSSTTTSNPSEMLFLLALHFHNNQMHAVTELVCNTLGMKCQVKASALGKIRQMFTMELFTEQVIATHAVKIPVTRHLDSRSTGYLPVHSILQLLKSRAFSKHKVSVKTWVFGQIKESRFPLHPLLPQLIESYVNTVIPKTLRPDHTNEPLGGDEIWEIFQQAHKTPPATTTPTTPSSSSLSDGERGETGRRSSSCSQLLILYYLLLYEDLYQTHKKMIDVRKLQPYPERVISEIPISVLVQEALKYSNNCQNLFPPMIKLLSTHFPHLCLVEDWLDMNSGLLQAATTSSSSSSSTSSSSVSLSALCGLDNSKAPISSHKFSKVLANALCHPGAAIRALEQVLDRNDLVTLQASQEAIVASVPMMLTPDMPQRLQDLLKKVWFRLHAIIPRRLRVSTVNALQQGVGGGGGVVVDKAASSSSSSLLSASWLSEQDLVVDPLVVLRCDSRVFRCPPVLEILLRIVSAYCQACRVCLNTHASDQASTVEKEKDRQELKTALLATQESAIVQILLEVCLEADGEEQTNPSKLSNLGEVRCLVFSYIHQVFIADPNLAKLVHFQGYPYQLVPLVVSSVPSMHICLDFIPELLGQPQRSKQVFGLQLLCHLCAQFHIPKAMHMARLGLDVMFTLLSVLEKEEWAVFFLQTLPALVVMCQVFPPLCDDASSLLVQLGRVCHAHMTVHGKPDNAAGLSADCPKADEAKSVSLYASLFHTIQTTFRQLSNRANLYC